MASARAEPGWSDAAGPRLRALAICRLDFVHRFAAGSNPSQHIGDLLHSLFGACLWQVDARAFAALMAPCEQRRPWALGPTTIRPASGGGETELHWSLSLFCDATDHAQACIDAARAMTAMAWGHPAAVPLGVSACRGGVAGAAWEVWHGAAAGCVDGPLALSFDSPLATRQGPHWLKHAPSMALVVARVVRRLEALSPQRREESCWRGDAAPWLGLAAQCPVERQSLAWVDWRRRSHRQQCSMTFGGLLGTVHYGGPAARLRPWLALAQALQLGARTTFGLGCVSVHAVPA